MDGSRGTFHCCAQERERANAAATPVPQAADEEWEPEGLEPLGVRIVRPAHVRASCAHAVVRSPHQPATICILDLAPSVVNAPEENAFSELRDLRRSVTAGYVQRASTSAWGKGALNKENAKNDVVFERDRERHEFRVARPFLPEKYVTG